MALQKNAEIFRHPVAAPINSLTAVIPNEVRDPRQALKTKEEPPKGSSSFSNIVVWLEIEV
jgi:hypothetical protein